MKEETGLLTGDGEIVVIGSGSVTGSTGTGIGAGSAAGDIGLTGITGAPAGSTSGGKVAALGLGVIGTGVTGIGLVGIVVGMLF